MIRKLTVCLVSFVIASGAGVLSSRALPVAPTAASSDTNTSIELVAKKYYKKKGDGHGKGRHRGNDHGMGHRHVKDHGHRHGHVNVRVRHGHWHGHRYHH